MLISSGYFGTYMKIIQSRSCKMSRDRLPSFSKVDTLANLNFASHRTILSCSFGKLKATLERSFAMESELISFLDWSFFRNTLYILFVSHRMQNTSVSLSYVQFHFSHKIHDDNKAVLDSRQFW